jgi:hydrogenase nickel incorporation protein HypA/HybF
VHELTITQSVLDIALKHARQAEAGRILRIHLIIGDLSGIVDDSVQFYFDFVSRDTPAEGAELVFRRVPARFRCRACGEEYGLGEQAGRRAYYGWSCPGCEELQPEILAGREFLVDSIEVE